MSEPRREPGPMPPSWVYGLVFFALFYSLALGLRIFIRSGADLFDAYGFHGQSLDFSFLRFLGYGFLPLGFNMVFGYHFATLLARRLGAGGRAGSVLLGLLGWWLLFNGPNFLEAWRLVSAPGFERPWLAPLLLLVPLWPSERLLLELRLELLLFYPLGNLGLWLGFAGGLRRRFGRRRPTGREGSA